MLGILAAGRWGGWGQGIDPKWARMADLNRQKEFLLPAMEIPTLGGDMLRLSAWQSRPVILVFWSTSGGGATEAAALDDRGPKPARLVACDEHPAGDGAGLAVDRAVVRGSARP